MSDPYELLDALGGDGRGDLTLPDQLRERACPAGKPWTANDPASDHGHTDCWLFHAAADEIERLRAAIEEATEELNRVGTGRGYYACRCDVIAEDITIALTSALKGTTDDN